ncbi:MAG: DNA polymerase IV [Patescibacteria group bacterium]
MQRVILHLDMNSYFASVEQQANPFLRGKPLAVLATMTSQGCALASSKEAKAFGVKTGIRADEARQLCPDITFVEVDPPKYRSTTKRIFSILTQYSETIEPYSIDEAFLDLTGLVPSLEAGAQLGYEIKQRIKDEIGEWLTCSMGLASTRWLAKFGGDTASKGGLVILHRENIVAYLKGRDLQEAWGIAGATAAHLNRLGITTLDELQAASPVNLMASFGIRGYELWANVNAVELGGLAQPRQPKSIGHSHVLRVRTRDPRFHKALVMRLCERAGRRLRDLGLEAQGVYAHVSLVPAGGLGGSKKVYYPIHTTRQLFQQVWAMLGNGLRQGTPSFYALGVFRLRPVSGQLSLLEKRKPAALARAIDRINNRYGEETIVEGELMRLDDYHAPERIGFRKTVDVDDELGI